MPLVVKGMADLQRALKTADRDVRVGIQAEYRRVAEPIRSSAEVLAETRIRNIGPKWGKTRTGITQKLLYVAPKERGIKRGDNPAKRPRFAKLLMTRAFDPALDQNAQNVRRDFDQMLETVARRFNS